MNVFITRITDLISRKNSSALQVGKASKAEHFSSQGHIKYDASSRLLSQRRVLKINFGQCQNHCGACTASKMTLEGERL